MGVSREPQINVKPANTGDHMLGMLVRWPPWASLRVARAGQEDAR
jgi:hypothetical protein